jgi:hypothetical protein
MATTSTVSTIRVARMVSITGVASCRTIFFPAMIPTTGTTNDFPGGGSRPKGRSLLGPPPGIPPQQEKCRGTL